MADSQAIDIFQEFVDLYAREDMLGFFGFTLNGAGEEKISGLCRMSKPKTTAGDNKMPYVSLTFVVDVPSDAVRHQVQAALGELDGDRLKKLAPGVADVVSVPVLSATGDNYVSQTDVLLTAGTDPNRMFVGGTLLPAFRNVAGLSFGDIVWWDDDAETPGAAAGVAALSNESLLNTLKNYVTSYLKPDKK